MFIYYPYVKAVQNIKAPYCLGIRGCFSQRLFGKNLVNMKTTVITMELFALTEQMKQVVHKLVCIKIYGL